MSYQHITKDVLHCVASKRIVVYMRHIDATTTEILSTMKQTQKHFHPVAGPSTENLYTTFSITEFHSGSYAGKKFLSRTIRNDYVIVASCQWGTEDSKMKAAELGLSL